MRRKLTASAIALAALAACAPNATLEPYAPSDGIRITIGEEVVANNFMILTAAEGEAGYLVGGLTNYADTPTTVSVAVGEHTLVVELDAEATVLLKPEADADVDNLIPAVPAKPGDLTTVELTSSTFGGSSGQVPILDGTLSPYDQYLP